MPAGPGVGRQDAGEERAGSTAHVDDRSDAREIVGFRDRSGRELRRAGHRLVENRGRSGVRGQVLEEWHPEDVVEGRLACPHAVEQATPCAVPLLAVCDRPGAQGAGTPAGQAAPSCRRLERPVLALPEHAQSGQRPHHAVQRRRMRRGGSGQLLDGPRALRQQVGDSELRRHVDDLREPVPIGHLLQGGLRLCSILGLRLVCWLHQYPPSLTP